MAIKTYEAGSLSALITTIVCSPLDVLKTRFQVQSQLIKNKANHIYKTYAQSFRFVQATEGIPGHFRGLTVSMLINSQTFGLSLMFKHMLLEHMKQIYNIQPLNPFANLLAGFVGGSIVYPFNIFYVIRTRMMTKVFANMKNNTTISNDNFILGTYNMLKNEGLQSSCKGASLNLLGNCIVSAMMLSGFDYIMQLESFILGIPRNNMPLPAAFFAGCIGRLISSIVDYPIELVRNRIYDESFNGFDYPNMKNVAKLVLKHDGFFGFYRGFGLTAIRSMPQMGIFFFLFEKFGRSFRKF